MDLDWFTFYWGVFDTHRWVLLFSQSDFVLESYKVDKGDHLPYVEFNVKEEMQWSTVQDDVNNGIFIILDIIFGFMDKNDNLFQ